MPWRWKNRQTESIPAFVGAHRADDVGSPPVSGRAPAVPIPATCPHASSMATGSDPCWIWLQSCRSPATALPSGLPSNLRSQTVLPPPAPRRRPQQPGSLELADRSNTPFGSFERYELDRASAVHPKCCCALCIAGTLLEWRQQRLIVFVVASTKRRAVRCVVTSIGNSLMEMRSPLL